jgi:hypothetical protein
VKYRCVGKLIVASCLPVFVRPGFVKILPSICSLVDVTFYSEKWNHNVSLNLQLCRPPLYKEIAVPTTTLNNSTPPAKNSNQPASISSAKFVKMTVVEQIRQAIRTDGRLAAFIGLWLGSSIPAMTFGLVHFVLPHYPELRILNWSIAVGGLLYSAPKVYHWGVSAWGSKIEAAGMVLILEGIMTFVPGLVLPSCALIEVVFINAVYSACRLQIR